LDTVNKKPNVVIIGAGPGGYTAAIRLGQLGMNPVVIEKEKVGGVCLNWGCIPTKTIYSTTEPLAKLDSWKKRGIEFNQPKISLSDVTKHQSKIANKLTDGVEKLIKSNGGTILYGKAEVTTGPKVIVKRIGKEEITLEPNNLIIASGSIPIELPEFVFSQDGIWDSKTAVMPPETPEKLVILGAGVIGLEMGTIYNRLGSEIKILEMQDSILPTLNLDKRIASYLNRSLKKSGIDIYTSTRAKELQTVEEKKMVIGEKDGKEVSIPADRVLVAVGRRPNLDFIDDQLGLEYNEGFIETDASCLTSIENVYAIGDIAGGPMLAHKASKEALIASSKITGEKITNYKVVPSAVFTDPEYAQVGMSERKARQNGYEPVIGRFPLRASGKAVAMDEATGAIKLVGDKDTDRLLGGSILGPHASDMIAELALSIETELTVTQIAETIHPHPTLSEAIMEAAENVHSRAIHTSNR